VARRLNGAKSRGPKTAAGRFRQWKSTISHGIRSECPVIPGVEKQHDWDNHLAALRKELLPKGPFEENLVYRIALNYWRLARLTKAETATIRKAIQNSDRRTAAIATKLEDAAEIQKADQEVIDSEPTFSGSINGSPTLQKPRSRTKRLDASYPG